MSKVVTVSNETYERLAVQAERNGLSVPALIERLVDDAEGAQIDLEIARMRAEGILLDREETPNGPSDDFQPIRVTGQPVSETILEERR